jgi:hypothetical protein
MGEADFTAATWEHYSGRLERDELERAWPIDATTRAFLADSRHTRFAIFESILARVRRC